MRTRTHFPTTQENPLIRWSGLVARLRMKVRSGQTAPVRTSDSSSSQKRDVVSPQKWASAYKVWAFGADQLVPIVGDATTNVVDSCAKRISNDAINRRLMFQNQVSVRTWRFESSRRYTFSAPHSGHEMWAQVWARVAFVRRCCL